MNAPQTPQVPAGGLLGMIAAIPQYIQALKVQKQQQQLQTMLAGNQELDIYRQQAATPGFKPTPEWTAAVTKIAKDHGMSGAIPFQNAQNGGVATAGPQGAGPGMTLPGQAQSAPQGPQIDLNAFTGRNPVMDFIQKNISTVDETDPGKRVALVEGATGQKVDPDEAKRLGAMPQELPPVQQEAREKSVLTFVNQRLNEVAKTGTASSLRAVVPVISRQLHDLYDRTNADGTKDTTTADDQVRALVDPVLDRMGPLELEKLAEGKAKAGLEGAQADFIRESAAAKIEKFKADAQLDKDRGAALKIQAANAAALLPYRMGALKAQVQNAYSRAASVFSTNARNNAEAKWYSERAQDIQATGDPRTAIAALSSIRAAKASTDAGVRSIQGDITRIQTSLTSMDPASRQKNDQIIQGLNAEINALKERSQQYDASITTLTNKMAPGANLTAPGAGATSPAPSGAGAQSAGSPQTQVNPANGKTYYLHPDGKYYLAPPQ